MAIRVYEMNRYGCLNRKGEHVPFRNFDAFTEAPDEHGHERLVVAGAIIPAVKQLVVEASIDVEDDGRQVEVVTAVPVSFRSEAVVSDVLSDDETARELTISALEILSHSHPRLEQVIAPLLPS